MNKHASKVDTNSAGAKLTWFLLILVVIALTFGFYGFMAQSESTGLVAIHGAALRTIQIFILNLGPSDLTNWQTRVASVIAPLTTVGATLAAFSGRLEAWRQCTSGFDVGFVRGDIGGCFLGRYGSYVLCLGAGLGQNFGFIKQAVLG